jgi:hypothetical protein
VLNLEEELSALVDALNQARIDYALCGALALAVRGFVRASVDIDLLIDPENASHFAAVAETLGFTALAKHDENGDVLSLDPLLVTAETQPAWHSRQNLPWRNRSVTVVSMEGIVLLKRLRGRAQDLVDIQRLFEDEITGTIASRIFRASQLHKLCLSLAKAKPAPPPAPAKK